MKTSAGRKAIAPAEVVDSGVDMQAVGRAGQAANALAVISAEISQRFGDGLPYDRTRVVQEARFFQAQSAEAMLELGKRLIQIKENEPHGAFLEVLEHDLRLPVRSAQRFMQASVRFLAPAANAPALTHLGRSKLFELLEASDEELDALSKGGTLAGMDLDDIQAMSTRELQQALREARQQAAAKDRVIETKNRKLDKLQEAEEARKHAPLPEQERLQLDELREAALAAESTLQRLLAVVDQVMATPATAAAEQASRHSLDYIVQRVVDGCTDRGITVDLAERVSPVWATQIDELVSKANTGRGKKAR